MGFVFEGEAVPFFIRFNSVLSTILLADPSIDEWGRHSLSKLFTRTLRNSLESRSTDDRSHDWSSATILRSPFTSKGSPLGDVCGSPAVSCACSEEAGVF